MEALSQQKKPGKITPGAQAPHPHRGEESMPSQMQKNTQHGWMSAQTMQHGTEVKPTRAATANKTHQKKGQEHQQLRNFTQTLEKN